jgi:hypothetical protein
LAASAMRTLLIVISLFYLSCSDNKTSETKIVKGDTSALAINDTFKIDCEQPNIYNLIVRSDTTFDSNNYNGHTIKSFDIKGRLLKTFVTNLFESNSKNIYSSTTVYDTSGHVIYDAKTKEFIRWHCYSYKYNINGNLISKTGYSSGEIGVKILYIYEGDRLIKEITERPGQKSEKLH